LQHGGRALRDTFRVTKKTYTQMLEEIEHLKRQAEEVRRREVEEVISRMKAAIAFYGLTEEDLGFKKPEKAASTPPPPTPAKKKKRKSRYTERPLAGPVRSRR
jgi:DNA-binding protein H-NS